MPRFRIDPKAIQNGKVFLNPKESHHAVSVLRVKTGDAVDLIDGEGNSFKGIVTIAHNSGLEVRVETKLNTKISSKDAPGSFRVTLAVSAIKTERMELLIQKACELGVHEIIPMRSERSIIKLSKERWQEKIKRWQKIASESCKQCGLAAIPKISESVDFKDVFTGQRKFDGILIPTLSATTKPLYDTLKKSPAGGLLVLIGPEGDFTKKETELAVSHGALPVSLGPLVLRTETAAIYVLSVINFFYREIEQVKENP